jgi:prepilin-type N-terminal cleavage/methylation domain-containing protein
LSVKRLLVSKRGFTLVEVVMSLVVFSLLVVIFAACVPLSQQSSSANGQYSQAMSLCQHKIDQCRAIGWGRLNYTELKNAGIIDTAPTTSPFTFEDVDTVTTFLPQATATLKVEDLSQTIGGTTVTYTKVTVTITWKNLTYKTKTSTATAAGYIANVD